MDRLTLSDAHRLSIEKYGEGIGMFGYLRTKSGSKIYGKYISFGLLKIITKAELLEFKSKPC